MRRVQQTHQRRRRARCRRPQEPAPSKLEFLFGCEDCDYSEVRAARKQRCRDWVRAGGRWACARGAGARVGGQRPQPLLPALLARCWLVRGRQGSLKGAFIGLEQPEAARQQLQASVSVSRQTCSSVRGAERAGRQPGASTAIGHGLTALLSCGQQRSHVQRRYLQRRQHTHEAVAGPRGVLPCAHR
jgi:hypothetical protein